MRLTSYKLNLYIARKNATYHARESPILWCVTNDNNFNRDGSQWTPQYMYMRKHVKLFKINELRKKNENVCYLCCCDGNHYHVDYCNQLVSLLSKETTLQKMNELTYEEKFWQWNLDTSLLMKYDTKILEPFNHTKENILSVITTTLHRLSAVV